MKKGFVFLLSLGFLLASCKSAEKGVGNSQNAPNRPNVPTQAFDQIPSWVKSRPSDPQYYYGVGSALIFPGSSEHFTEARNQALNQIAGEIQTRIESKSLLTRFETNARLREDYFTEIKAKVNLQIEAYEKVADAKDGNRYYVLYRLNRTEYWRKIEEARMAALQKAANVVLHAEELLAQGLVLPGMQSLLSALTLLEPYADKQLTLSVNGQERDLAAWIGGTMSRILTQLQLSLEPALLELSIGMPADSLFLNLKASFEGQPVSQMPLTWRMAISGTNVTRDMTGEPTTNPRGEARLRLPAISNQSALVVTAETSPHTWFHDSLVPSYIRSFLQGFVRTASARITFRKPRLLVQVAEFNLGQAPSYPLVDLMVREYLEKHGFVLVSDPSLADISMEVEASTEPGGNQGGIFIAYGTLRFSGTRLSDNTPVFSKVMERLKGADLSYEAAGRRAFSSNRELILKELDVLFGM